MRKIVWLPAMFAATLLAATATAASARADVVARINLAAQQMTVSVDGFVRHVWPVSTARRGYTTPLGSYRPIRLERSWYSRKYNNAPMPYAIFFKGGYAIHGTNETSAIGMPVSHGCVRLHTENARTLFRLVKEQSARHTRIVVVRDGPVHTRSPFRDRDGEAPRHRPFFFFPFLGPDS